MYAIHKAIHLTAPLAEAITSINNAYHQSTHIPWSIMCSGQLAYRQTNFPTKIQPLSWVTGSFSVKIMF